MSLPRTQMPSLQELTAFEGAARHGSFTRAAAELGLTQSAISKQIQQLEAALGTSLFRRVGGRAILTRLGEQYAASIQDILMQYQSATHAVIASGGRESTLQVAVLPTFASRWLIPRLPAFMKAHPSTGISLTAALAPFDFAQKPVDVAIHYGAADWPQAEMTYLRDESIIAVASPCYCKRRRIRAAADLADAALLQLATRPDLWRYWFDKADASHPHPWRGPMFDQFSMTCEAAAAGLGVALVPAFLVERDLQAGILKKLKEPPFPGTGAYYAVTSPRNSQRPMIKAFVEWLAHEMNYSAKTAAEAHTCHTEKFM